LEQEELESGEGLEQEEKLGLGDLSEKFG